MKRSSGAAPIQTPPWPIFEAADEIQFFGEDFARFEAAVAVFVGQNDDAVEPFARRTFGGITERLGDPNAATLVPGQGDRLADVGFGGDELDFETFGNIHLRERVSGVGTRSERRGGGRG